MSPEYTDTEKIWEETIDKPDKGGEKEEQGFTSHPPPNPSVKVVQLVDNSYFPCKDEKSLTVGYKVRYRAMVGDSYKDQREFGPRGKLEAISYARGFKDAKELAW